MYDFLIEPAEYNNLDDNDYEHYLVKLLAECKRVAARKLNREYRAAYYRSHKEW